MELYQLHCFKIAAECESITKAAQALYISQPSLSQTIRRLEKELGYPPVYITLLGACIATNTGPDTIALIFEGKPRR